MEDIDQELFDLAIILPVYNTEKYIKQCIESILCQIKENMELIIVNDGCTDSSMKIIKSLSLPSNVFIIDKQNEGRFWAKVDGMRMAKAKYIGFVDSDDYIEKNMLDKMLQLAKQEKSDIVECLTIPFSESGMIEKQIHIIQKRNTNLQQLKNKKLNNIDILKFYFLDEGISPFLWSKIFSKRCIYWFLKYIDKYNNTRSRFIGNPVDDIYIMPALLVFANSFSVCPERLYYYRIMSENSFNQQIEEDYKKKLDVLGYRYLDAFQFIETMFSKLHIDERIKNLHFIFLGRNIENFYHFCIESNENTRKLFSIYKKVWKKRKMFQYSYYAFLQKCYYEKRKMNKNEKIILLKILIY